MIKGLPGECADWFFNNIIMTWSYCLHRRYSMSQQKKSILINEHALNHEPVPIKGLKIYVHFLSGYFANLGRFVQKVENTIHQINLYPKENTPGGPWCLTFALGQLENLSFFIQIICWPHWILQFHSTEPPPIFLGAQPCICWEMIYPVDSTI